jgi:hypothetical protein
MKLSLLVASKIKKYPLQVHPSLRKLRGLVSFSFRGLKNAPILWKMQWENQKFP